jgi:low temperature requirement protein LtrA
MVLLLAGPFADGGLRVALWVAAAAIDYAGPAWLTRERLRSLQQVAVAHFAERYSLFIVLAAADGYSYLHLLLVAGIIILRGGGEEHGRPRR